jgi:hypothetical protein
VFTLKHNSKYCSAINPLKFGSTIALFLIAVALTQAAPAHNDAAWDIPPTAEETPAHETVLADVSHANAKKRVTQMLQTGKDENACKDLAKVTSDEVIASVATQQKTLDSLPKGGEECDDEGQGLISNAESGLKEAQDTQQTKAQALTDANSQKINFGDFAFDQLQEGQCSSFFNQKVWQDAKAAVATATTELNTANAAVTAAEKALNDAKLEAAEMVAKCRCSANALLEKTLKEMNEDAKVANTKAWKEAAHMLCVLDGTPEDSCSVPVLPTVKAVEVSDKAKEACGIEFTVAKDSFVSGGEYSGKKFSLSLLKPTSFSVEAADGGAHEYATYCNSFGLLPVGCGGTTYKSHDCQLQQGEGKCISVPDTCGCNAMRPMRNAMGITNKRVLAYTSNGKKSLYTSNGYHDNDYHPKSGTKYYTICGKFLE